MLNDKLGCNVELILENARDVEGKMRCFYDFATSDLVGFSFKYDHQDISLTNERAVGEGQEHFHLDKTQIGFFIDFLKRLQKKMNYPQP